MMRILYKASIFMIVITLLMACSRKKNTFLNRNMRALATEYNVLYNGEIAFEDAKVRLASQFQDNFWEILPIERIEIKENLDEGLRPTEKGNFSVAEEKATKAIQKHSMYIKGKEYNSKIDEAFLLLGKARYYEGRFIPAMDAFNFILERYPESNSVNKARVWRAKTNIRLNNEENAIENLGKMFERGELEADEEVDAHAMIAQAYINMDSLPQALEHIKVASNLVKDKELKGRYAFIKGQLNNKLEEKDSANLAFDEVIDLNRKTSRKYLIAAHMEKIRNFDYENGNHESLVEKLEKLGIDRENRPFLDRIFYETAEYYYNVDSIETAISFYNKSIQNFKQDKILQSKNYQTLAEINFDHAQYRTAGAYYDSTLTFLKEKSRDWRLVKKKRENLDDVIYYEDIATANDSIIRIVNMNEAERLAYFTDYTNKLKEQAVQDSIAQAKVEQAISDNEFYRKRESSGEKEGGSFYFYNQSTVAHGKQSFRSVWGDRRLEDNWRLSTKKTMSDIEDDQFAEQQQTISIAENELFKPETYLAKIPADSQTIDSIISERNFAYYQLGLIYKEKFKEPELASERLEKLLTFEPEERLVVASEYHLVKIYQELENEERMNYFKNDILNNFADTRYAEILRNPDVLLETDKSSPEYKYKELYHQFESHQYPEVISKAEEYIVLYDGTEMVPKFELLKATAIGKQDGFIAYKKALNFVSLNYPNSKEGQQAQNIYDQVLPGLESVNFNQNDREERWKLVYQFSKEEQEEAEALKEILNKAISDLHFSNMKVSMDYYTNDLNFVVVHGMSSKLGTQGFGETLRDKKEYQIKHPFFAISSSAYKIVQIHKNLEDYLNPKSDFDSP